MPMPMIEFLFWRDCPSHQRALAMLQAALSDAGVDAAELTITEVETDQQAAARDFPGSPTILVDGVDIQDTDDQPRGLTCRVYRRRDGRISPLPDPADIADALAARTGPNPRSGR